MRWINGVAGPIQGVGLHMGQSDWGVLHDLREISDCHGIESLFIVEAGLPIARSSDFKRRHAKQAS